MLENSSHKYGIQNPWVKEETATETYPTIIKLGQLEISLNEF